MNYRHATLSDIPVLITLRKAQLIDEGLTPDCDIDAQLLGYFNALIPSDNFVVWLLEENEQIVATGAINFFQLPPSYMDPAGIKGYLCNIYTHPTCRGRGIATHILDRLRKEAADRNILELYIAASDMGRPVYEKCGYRPFPALMTLNV